MNSASPETASGLDSPKELSSRGRYLILATAFLGWMCAGMQMINFPLATGSIVRDLHGKVLAEDSQLSQKERKEQINIKVGQWFGYYVVAFLLGAASGGLIFGWMGDRIGRAKTMGLSILCYSLLHGLAYFTPFSSSLQTLLLLRFLACFGVGGMWPTGVALVSEAWTNASRPFLAGLIGTSANVGIALIGVIGQLREVTQDDWRWLMLVSAVPAVLGVFVLIFVPESPRWLSRRQTARTQEVSGSPLAIIFRPPLRRLTIIGILLGTVPLLGGWGTNNWLINWADKFGEKHGDPGLKATTIWVGSTGAAIGSLFGGWLASLFGRRPVYFVVSLVSLLLSGVIFWTLSPADGFLFLAMVFALRLVSTIYFGWLPLYLPELFPTHVRSTGTGVTFNFGRILTAVGVLGTGALVGYFDGANEQAGRITHLVFALGMIVILFAPDNSDSDLRD